MQAVQHLYPHLELRNLFGVAAFFVPGEKKSVIDVTIPHCADIQETLSAAIWVEGHGLRYRIPALETALANKYGAMLSINRDYAKRYQDLADFAKMVRHAAEEGGQSIDLEWLRDLGEKVWPGGGGDELLQLAANVREGRNINLDVLMNRI